MLSSKIEHISSPGGLSGVPVHDIGDTAVNLLGLVACLGLKQVLLLLVLLHDVGELGFEALELVQLGELV